MGEKYKELIIVNEIEDKTTSSNKTYARVNTDKGWMSCWDSKNIQLLKEWQGCECLVEMEDKGNFKNITNFLSAKEGAVKTNPTVPSGGVDVEIIKPFAKPAFKREQHSVPQKQVQNHTTMYVSYAKDIFCALLEKYETGDNVCIMKEAIELVKQARLEFEK